MTTLINPFRPLLEVADLDVAFGRAQPVLQQVSFSLYPGECLALVGESGSGKSVTSRTLAGLTGAGAQIRARRLAFDGQDLLNLGGRQWRELRGSRIGFVMQDALGSLDPLRQVGREIDEPLRLHTPLDRERRQQKVLDLLRAVGVPEAELRARQYPHQLSGGLRQRALIASAIACDPDLLIADEPTTALDATVQAQVLNLLESLRQRNRAMLVVSHDLAVVARLAHRVAVMQHGVIVEEGPVDQVLEDPRHPYTRSLLRAASAVHLSHAPQPAASEPPPASLGAQPVVLEARQLAKHFRGPNGAAQQAVANASFTLRAGETLGIVGESGSGKTTLTRMILGLERPDSGEVYLRGQAWSALDTLAQRRERRRIQVVFQDPLASFDPRYSVARVLDEALARAGGSRAERQQRARELLELVRLPAGMLQRRPIELSGGQRQRIAIARALAAQPEILVCDEPVSALDVSVQAQILDLLADLKQRLGLACLFISHDLGVVRHVSDRVLVMKDGHIVESGPVREVFARPQHDYTRALLGAIPHLPQPRERRIRVEAIAR
ncbi:ABC transporter ATP-binding protein [Pseudomonas citronellolis]|uniref:dipeptide ABC transporter ATP-binding protein n=1 Tax=Pseudomonas citronellolis TaxID=53408 RepID=UPI0021127A31|nr:ABC transporter ATP-binding protein [Pseudomonas citronellolis]MDN6875460.1 ABC transporter ATP-binding protein [Pseudomonas citronellolis]UUC52828.1 ABC transporter ATP-binding protein [Pseudomonas citronellolis]